MGGGNSMFARRVAALLVVLGGCAITDAASTGEKGSARTTTAVPANYRQLVAARILETTDRQKIRRDRYRDPRKHGLAWSMVAIGQSSAR